MKKSFSADEIGDIAEDTFKSICSHSGITATKPDRDRFGWDYLLEFKSDLPVVILDETEMNYFCNVQVKGFDCNYEAYSGRGIKLSNIKTMIDRNSPQFFVFIQADYVNRKVILVHFDNKLIQKGLERIRQAQNDNTDLHKTEMTINPHQHNSYEISIDNLKAVLTKIIGPSMTSYEKEKTQFKEVVGYENGKYEIVCTANVSDMVDVHLGLRNKVPVELQSISSLRFGIPIQLDSKSFSSIELISDEFVPAELRQPLNKGKCIEIELIGDSKSFDISGQIIFSYEPTVRKFVIDSKYFKFIYSEGKSTVNLKNEEIINGLCDIYDLNEFIDIAIMLTSGGSFSTNFYLESKTYKTRYIISDLNDKKAQEFYEGILNYLEDLRWLFDFLSIEKTEKVCIGEYLNRQDKYKMLIKFLREPECSTLRISGLTTINDKKKLCVLLPMIIRTHLGEYALVKKCQGKVIQFEDALVFAHDSIHSFSKPFKCRGDFKRKLSNEIREVKLSSSKLFKTIIIYEALTPEIRDFLKSEIN